ncbi:MAG: divergent polysaccharide deacetylase family protein, partial [Woeseiaceae bacterium]
MSLPRIFLAALLLLAASDSVDAGPARVAIIIDDLGYQLAAGRRAIALPGPIAFAVLPGTP